MTPLGAPLDTTVWFWYITNERSLQFSPSLLQEPSTEYSQILLPSLDSHQNNLRGCVLIQIIEQHNHWEGGVLFCILQSLQPSLRQISNTMSTCDDFYLYVLNE